MKGEGIKLWGVATRIGAFKSVCARIGVVRMDGTAAAYEIVVTSINAIFMTTIAVASSAWTPPTLAEEVHAPL